MKRPSCRPPQSPRPPGYACSDAPSCRSPTSGSENGCVPDSLNSFRNGRGYWLASQNRCQFGSSCALEDVRAVVDLAAVPAAAAAPPVVGVDGRPARVLHRPAAEQGAAAGQPALDAQLEALVDVAVAGAAGAVHDARRAGAHVRIDVVGGDRAGQRVRTGDLERRVVVERPVRVVAAPRVVVGALAILTAHRQPRDDLLLDANGPDAVVLAREVVQVGRAGGIEDRPEGRPIERGPISQFWAMPS